MAIITTPPPPIGFSRDRIIWEFEDDFADVVPGINAVNTLSVVGDVPDGARVIFRWGETEMIFTASDTPDPTAATIPTYIYSDLTEQAYIDSLVPYFQSNYFISKDFVVDAYLITLGPLSRWVVRFTAKTPGKAYNVTNTRFGLNGVQVLVEGTDTKHVINNSVAMELLLGDRDGETYELIYSAALELDKTGRARVDVANILHSQLASEIPSFITPVAMKCQDSRREYYLRYAQAGGENFSIGPMQTTEHRVVLLGGFAEKKAGPQNVIDTFAVVSGQSKFLRLHGPRRYVRQDEPVFVSWINFTSEDKDVVVRARIYYTDDTTVDTNTVMIYDVRPYEKVMFSVGPRSLNLAYFNAIKPVREYEIYLADSTGTAISETITLTINYAYEEFVRYFAHVNSWGAIETLSTYGKGSSAWKVFKESAEKVMPLTFDSSEAQYVEWNLQYQETGEVATGFLPKKELRFFLDFFISPIKFRLIKGAAYAVAVNSDTIARGTDGDNLHGLTFEYQFQRRFDAITEDELEGDDVADYIPSGVILAGNIVPATGSNPNGRLGAVDPYPIQGSDNAVSSNSMYLLLQEKQDKLPIGDATQYYRADGRIMNFGSAVRAAEQDPTVPSFAKSLTDLSVIFNALQALNPGLNVNLFGGENPEYYLKRMTHPAFLPIPPIVVQRYVTFTKYINLATYLTSYHEITDLTVDIKYNDMALDGLEVTAEGLLLKVAGTISQELTSKDRILITVRDQHGNQIVKALVLESLAVAPEEPDTRPECAHGPFHWPSTAIVVMNAGKLKVPFDAAGVPVLRFKIVTSETDTTSLRSGEVPANPGDGTMGSHIFAEFDPLPGGNYLIGISGGLCKSNWQFRAVTIPNETILTWATGYPKYEGGVFKAKVMLSANYLTEVVNTATNTIVYSDFHDYVANVTEIEMAYPGGWPDGPYRINVGTVTGLITIGASGPDYTFRLHKSWDGAVLANLRSGPYEGGVPADGFNAALLGNMGFNFNYCAYKCQVKVAGVWTDVDGTFSGGIANFSTVRSQLTTPLRMFGNPGVDSRFIIQGGFHINRPGEVRFTYEFRNGGSGGAVTGTITQTMRLRELKVTGAAIINGGGSASVVTLGRVKLDGSNIINNGVWLAPFTDYPELAAENKLVEWSVDGGATWNRTIAELDRTGLNDTSNLGLLNATGLDLFPAGSVRSVLLRTGYNHNIVSLAYSVANGTTIPSCCPGMLISDVHLENSDEWTITS